MGFIVSIILLLIGLLKHRRKKTWVAPDILFCFIWCVVTALASLRLFSINRASFETWIIILVGTVAFSVGASFYATWNKKKVDQFYLVNKPEAFIGAHNGYITKKLFIFLLVIFGALALQDLLKTVQLFSRGYSLDLIRGARNGLIEISGYKANIADSFMYTFSIIKTAIHAVLVASGIEYYFIDTKKNGKFLIVSILLVAIDAFTDGGRWGIAYFFIELLVGFKLYRGEGISDGFRKMSHKTRRRIIVLLSLVVVFIIYITIARWSGDLWQHLYIYFCGCIPLLDIYKDYLQANELFSFVFAGQYGIWSLILPILTKLTGFAVPLYVKTSQDVMIAQTVTYIGGGNEYNAFITAFYYLFADLRFMGVFIGMFVFGLMAGNMYHTAVDRKSDKYLVPYLLITQMMLKTIQIYPFSSPTYVMVIAFILYFNYRHKKDIAARDISS